MKQKKNHHMRNWFLGTALVGCSVLGLALSAQKPKEVKPFDLEREVESSVVQPAPEIEKPELVVKERNKEFSYLECYDNIIKQTVSKLNKKHNQNLDSDLIRALIVVESGDPRHRDNAFKYDPMQIANPGSYAVRSLGNREEHTNLIGDFSELKGKRKTPRNKEGELDYSNTNMTAKEGIKGGVGWLFHKAAVYDERIIEEGPLSEYVVKEKDSFWKIAIKYGSTEETLRKYNPGIAPKKIKPGQKLNFRRARKEMYISRWRNWKTAVDRYGDQTLDYSRKVHSTLKKLKKN